MNFITFKSLSIENFLSVGKSAIVLDLNSKINIITGKNYDKDDSKNGVGKSTIVDALHFALYGSTIREITKEQIVNTSTGKNCSVSLTFSVKTPSNEDEYTIVRTISPTKCSLFKNKMNVTLSTIAKTTELIQGLLNCSSKVFQNSVVMSINNTTPFLAQSKVDKRKYIESILHLEVFSQMLLKAREEYSETKHKYDITRVKHLNSVNNVNTLNQQIEIFELEKKNSIQELEKTLTQKCTLKDELKLKFEEFKLTTIEEVDFTDKTKKLNEKLEELQKVTAQLSDKRTQIITERKILSSQLKKLTDISQPCPTCKRAFTEEHKCEDAIQEVNSKLDKLQSDLYDKDIEKNNSLIAKVKTALSSLHQQEKDQYNLKNTHNNNINNIQLKIDNLIESIESINASIKQKQESSNTKLVELLKVANTELNLTQDLVNSDETHLQLLDCVKHVLSEEGVKSYLIKKILNVLNQKVSQYLVSLDAPVKCEFNEFFDEKISDEKNNEKSYSNFSGGERKRIDLACLFAFMDMKRLQGETIFNTTFYDELLDSSLDEKGVDLVLDVLRGRNTSYNEGCYIITHRGQHVLNKVDSVITLEKRNGFTYILKDREL